MWILALIFLSMVLVIYLSNMLMKIKMARLSKSEYNKEQLDKFKLDRVTKNIGRARLHLEKIKKSSKFKIKIKHGQVCPLCKDELASSEYICDGCNTAFHNECINELARGQCTTFGCGKTLHSKVLT